MVTLPSSSIIRLNSLKSPWITPQFPSLTINSIQSWQTCDGSATLFTLHLNKISIVCLIALRLRIQTIIKFAFFILYMNIHNIVLLHNLHRVTTEEFHNNCMSVKVHWFRNRELSLIECLRRNVEVRCLRLLQREKYKYQHTTLIICAICHMY